MERDEALSALREVAVEVLSVEPDAVVEDRRSSRKTSTPTASISSSS